MKYNKGFAPLVVLLIVLGVLVVGGVAYFLIKSSTPTNEVLDNSNYLPTTEQNDPVLTQSQANLLVHQTWSDCSQGDCGGVVVTVIKNSIGQYVVTAIFTELDDSISQTKKVSVATYQNGTWALGKPTITRMCHRGNSDGTIGWTAGLCI